MRNLLVLSIAVVCVVGCKSPVEKYCDRANAAKVYPPEKPQACADAYRALDATKRACADKCVADPDFIICMRNCDIFEKPMHAPIPKPTTSSSN